MLHVLLRADGAVVSPETLLERVWDEHVDPFTNTVRVTVMNLRRKLGDAGRDRDGHRYRVPSELSSRAPAAPLHPPAPHRVVRDDLHRDGDDPAGGLLRRRAPRVPRRAGQGPRRRRGAHAGEVGRADDPRAGSRPGIPPENTSPVRTLSADERDAYRQARNAYAAQVHAANDRALSKVLLAFGGALLLVTLASVAAGWIVAGRALRPISRITSTARSISERTLDARIALDGPRDELRELADTFDSMLERLEAAFESQRRFVANASHELRTPLAIVRTELDVTLDDPDADRDELRAMASSCATPTSAWSGSSPSLLALASSEAGIVQARGADLAEIVAPALDREERLRRRRRAAARAAARARAGRGRSGAARAPGREPHRERGPLQRRRRLGARAHRDRARRGGPARRQPRRAHRPGRRSRSCSSPSAAWSPRARARPAATASAWPSSAPWRRPTAAASRCWPAARAASR